MQYVRYIFHLHGIQDLGISHGEPHQDNTVFLNKLRFFSHIRRPLYLLHFLQVRRINLHSRTIRVSFHHDSAFLSHKFRHFLKVSFVFQNPVVIISVSESKRFVLFLILSPIFLPSRKSIGVFSTGRISPVGIDCASPGVK